MKIKHIKSTLLTLDSGEEVFLRYHARGAFSRMFKTRDGKTAYLITDECDWSKLLLADLEPQRHIPEVEQLGHLNKHLVFRMPVYAPVTRKCTVAWRQATDLQSILREAWRNFSRFRVNYRKKGLDVMGRVVQLARETPHLETSLVRALDTLKTSAEEFGPSFVFEFPRRNLAVDTEQNLILLDTMFEM